MTYVKSKLSLFFLSDGSVHSYKNTIGISLLHIVELSNNESQQIGRHDGSASKRHTLQVSLQLLTANLILVKYKHVFGYHNGT